MEHAKTDNDTPQPEPSNEPDCRATHGSAPADADLLNWLERNASWVSHAKGCLHGPDAWMWRDRFHVWAEAPSLRDAIRSAIKASEPNNQVQKAARSGNNHE